MIVYLDTSAVARRYFREEPGSSRVAEHCAEKTNRLVGSELMPVEFASALARRRREGLIDGELLRLAWRTFCGDLRSQFRLAPVDGQVQRVARRLLLAHPLRTLDALHLATAHRLRSLEHEEGADWLFLTADSRQEAAAKAEGWRTDLLPG